MHFDLQLVNWQLVDAGLAAPTLGI